MLYVGPMSDWVKSLITGCHGCFFYSAESEYFQVINEFLSPAFSALHEKVLWIVPPHMNLSHATQTLQHNLKSNLKEWQKEKRLVILPWERWFGHGDQFDLQALAKKGRYTLQETLKEGYQSLRILTHALPRRSPHWEQFLKLEEWMDKKLYNKPMLSLCGYRLLDCPTESIPDIANMHAVSLIRQGDQWQPIHRDTLQAKSA